MMNPPPVIFPARKSVSGSAPVWAFAGLLLLLTVARVAAGRDLPLPFCGLKRLTGIPCPFCGSTRCLQACSTFDFAGALRWNPLLFMICVGVIAGFAAWLADRSLNRRWLDAAHRLWRIHTTRLILLGAVLLNWIYLWRTLP